MLSLQLHLTCLTIWCHHVLRVWTQAVHTSPKHLSPLWAETFGSCTGDAEAVTALPTLGCEEPGSGDWQAGVDTWTARCCRESLRKGRGWVAALVDCRPSIADTSFLPASCTHHATSSVLADSEQAAGKLQLIPSGTSSTTLSALLMHQTQAGKQHHK